MTFTGKLHGRRGKKPKILRRANHFIFGQPKGFPLIVALRHGQRIPQIIETLGDGIQHLKSLFGRRIAPHRKRRSRSRVGLRNIFCV
jgi:hypothetical protein